MNAKRQDLSFFGLDAIMAGESNRGKEMMVFDWNKAATLIKGHKDYPNITCEAGLASDWEYTGGVIFRDGQVVKEEYTYLASTWAIPTLIIDEEEYDCFIMENSTEWDEKTKWPEESLKILVD